MSAGGTKLGPIGRHKNIVLAAGFIVVGVIVWRFFSVLTPKEAAERAMACYLRGDFQCVRSLTSMAEIKASGWPEDWSLLAYKSRELTGQIEVVGAASSKPWSTGGWTVSQLVRSERAGSFVVTFDAGRVDEGFRVFSGVALTFSPFVGRREEGTRFPSGIEKLRAQRDAMAYWSEALAGTDFQGYVTMDGSGLTFRTWEEARNRYAERVAMAELRLSESEMMPDR